MFTPEEDEIVGLLGQISTLHLALPSVTGTDYPGEMFRQAVVDARVAMYARLGQRDHDSNIQLTWLERDVESKTRERDRLVEEIAALPEPAPESAPAPESESEVVHTNPVSNE